MTCSMCGFESTTPTCTNSSCQACLAVGKLDEEINEVVTTLRRLLATRRNVHSEQNRVHDPMHRLPIELRNHIFELLLPRRDEWGGILHFSKRRNVMPSHLASICKSWNNTALSNPLLWLTMDLRIGGRPSRPISTFSQIRVVRECILRAQSLPLILKIEAKEEEGIEDELNGVLDAISQSSTKRLSLSLDMSNELLRSFHHSNFPYHQLKRLRIYSELDGLNEPMPLFNPKVSPEVIYIKGILFQQLQISWNHLTSATIIGGFDGGAEVIRLLELASQMTSCSITLVPASRFKLFSMYPIIHQRLKKFSVFNASRLEAMFLLEHLTLPSLQAFHTNRTVHLTPNNLPALVRRSSCPLTELNFGGYDSDDLQAPRVLQPLPGVTHVVVHSMSDVVFEKLFVEECFPDLLRLWLRLELFLRLWDKGIILVLPALNRTHAGAERRFKLIIMDKYQNFMSGPMANPDFRKHLRSVGIRWVVDG